MTVTGTGFTGATAVTFGHVAASSFTVVSDTEITAVSPPQGAGTHGILVTTAGGTTPVVSAGYFVYKVPVPAVTAISPASGSPLGGTTVTVTGTGFTGATAVRFGSVAASSFTVVSDTEITAVSPPQAAGTHGILVTTPGGTTPVVKAGYFVYTATAPNVHAASPASFVDLAYTAPSAVQRSSWFRAAQ